MQFDMDSAHYDVSEDNMYLEVPTAEESVEELACEILHPVVLALILILNQIFRLNLDVKNKQ